MNNKHTQFVRFVVSVPKFALDFAEEHGVKMDIQELTLSAIAGYFNTFASLSPGSRFPLVQSRKTAKRIDKLETFECRLCPFCLMFSFDESTRISFTQDYDQCNLLLNLARESLSGN